ncbi:hypothetical protein Vadar_012504 [Vaccinium darrowii]|uniref:Uncharacterized protein n=1 Tax=Vaccinium darrowii TaxID=229202 RepID=A0ACB7Z3S9_9ERIC|nr:hypothetical protein Vadar_012504 [Vaccinium darrowii]
MDTVDSPEPQQPQTATDTHPLSSTLNELLTSEDHLTSQFSTLNDLCPELSSLHDLATRGSYRSILDKVSRARKLSLLSLPHHHLTYLSYNALALTKLRRYSDAAAEIDSLQFDLDSPNYTFQFYPQLYPNQSGSFVPFALRWIHALLPEKLGKRNETLDRLYTLLDFVTTKLKKQNVSLSVVSAELWRKREVFVINSIISHHLSQKEFGVCLDLIENLVDRRREFKDTHLDTDLLSKLGYIQLQYGDLEGAKRTFDRIEGLVKEKMGEAGIRNLVSRNKALVYLVGKDYMSAVREYEECIERDGSDVVAVNNKAICLMYLRELSGSISVLESALERVPTVALNETLVVNLCSMYELAYINHSDIKRTLSNWIARVAPDDFDTSCTRV